MHAPPSLYTLLPPLRRLLFIRLAHPFFRFLSLSSPFFNPSIVSLYLCLDSLLNHTPKQSLPNTLQANTLRSNHILHL